MQLGSCIFTILLCGYLAVQGCEALTNVAYSANDTAFSCLISFLIKCLVFGLCVSWNLAIVGYSTDWFQSINKLSYRLYCVG